MFDLENLKLEQVIPSEAEIIASEILDRIYYSPELANEIGNLLIEFAERDIAEAMKNVDENNENYSWKPTKDENPDFKCRRCKSNKVKYI